MSLKLQTDVLVIGGMAAAWAAIGAAREGASVTVVDKGYLGTSGVTATAGPGHWFIPPDPAKREAAIAQRQAIAFGLGEPEWMARIIEQTWRLLPGIAQFYKYTPDDDGNIRYGAVRGPEYMRALRQMVQSLGVTIIDQSPALELLRHADGAIAGAAGINRQTAEPWSIRAGGVVLATGGCAFYSRLLGSQTNTGDGYLMAAEAGAALSGMEFSSHYTIAPAFSTMARGMAYAYATYYGADKKPLDLPQQAGRNRALAKAMLEGPVYCDFSEMPQDIRDRLPTISPNVLPPFTAAASIRSLTNFVLLLAEGTIRGMGGIKIEDETCQTAISGLYAADDAASRELVNGAISGGGSINSAWALSSGTWAGQAAARRAASLGIRADKPAHPIGQAGLRPTGLQQNLDPMEFIKIVRFEAIHYDRNYFRTEQKLTRSLSLLDGLWQTIRQSLSAPGIGAVRAREAAAITATARWSFTAALNRRESRGMHARIDIPQQNPVYARQQTLTGLHRIHSDFEIIAAGERAA